MASFNAEEVKVVKFRRLSNNHIAGYMIYGIFDDDSYSSGKRTESLLKDTMGNDIMYVNPLEPVRDLDYNRVTLDLEYNPNVTWTLPEDIYYGRDFKIILTVNSNKVPRTFYDYNNFTRRLTINTSLKPIEETDKIRVVYWRDYIVLKFPVEQECDVIVKPVFKQGYGYGTHNIII